MSNGLLHGIFMIGWPCVVHRALHGSHPGLIRRDLLKPWDSSAGILKTLSDQISLAGCILRYPPVSFGFRARLMAKQEHYP